MSNCCHCMLLATWNLKPGRRLANDISSTQSVLPQTSGAGVPQGLQISQTDVLVPRQLSTNFSLHLSHPASYSLMLFNTDENIHSAGKLELRLILNHCRFFFSPLISSSGSMFLSFWLIFQMCNTSVFVPAMAISVHCTQWWGQEINLLAQRLELFKLVMNQAFPVVWKKRDWGIVRGMHVSVSNTLQIPWNVSLQAMMDKKCDLSGSRKENGTHQWTLRRMTYLATFLYKCIILTWLSSNSSFTAHYAWIINSLTRFSSLFNDDLCRGCVTQLEV